MLNYCRRVESESKNCRFITNFFIKTKNAHYNDCNGKNAGCNINSRECIKNIKVD